jgi:hypothetical protein
MKRLIALILTTLAVLFLLSGCGARAVEGKYTLTKTTTEARRIRPSEISMNSTFIFNDDGTGSANLNGNFRTFTWTEDDSTVTAVSSKGTLVFTKDGKDLLLHDDGTILTFEPEEEED